MPLIDGKGNVYGADDGARSDSTPEKLAKLKPFFDKKYGNVTPGNSSQITDGGVWLLLATRAAVEKNNLSVRGKITDTQWAGCDPAQMGLARCTRPRRSSSATGSASTTLDSIEINEAFAAQVLACKRAGRMRSSARTSLASMVRSVSIDMNKLNVDGGAVALVTGRRLRRPHRAACAQNSKRTGASALATICIGGGQGGAMLVEAA